MFSLSVLFNTCCLLFFFRSLSWICSAQYSFVFFFFFFQAEDGIRDLYVTGVQTCALPIFCRPALERPEGSAEMSRPVGSRSATFPPSLPGFRGLGGRAS